MSEILRELFEANVVPEPMSGCFLWLGPWNSNGYGVLYHKRRAYKAHRLAWEFAHGPIPEGNLVCHKCDNRACVADGHLFTGSVADNNLDKIQKGRHPGINKTVCKYGHLLSGPNMALAPGKTPDRMRRWCRACKRESQLRRYHKDIEAARGETLRRKRRERALEAGV